MTWLVNIFRLDCYSQHLYRQSSMRAIYCFDLLSLLCFSIRSVYLFFKAFSVLPQNEQTIQDHFFSPLLFLMRVRSCMSSQGSQGPFFSFGLRKQFQCSLHCLALLYTFASSWLRKQSSSATIFQFRLVNLLTKLTSDCFYWMIYLSSSLSRESQLNEERLFFFMESHLNMQLLALTPGISCDIFCQSSQRRSFSMLLMQCLSQYLEMTHTSTFTSSSLQFFFIFLFFTIFSILKVTSRIMVSSLMYPAITLFTRFTCSQCCSTSLRIYDLRCSCKLETKSMSFSLAQWSESA